MGLLEVRGLTVGFGGTAVVAGLDLTVAPGETVALVGPSGSGKTLTALALMRLLPRGATSGGGIAFAGQDVRAMAPRQLDRLRGGGMAMLFQQPLAMLDPSATVGSQVAEAVRLHTGLRGRAASDRVVELLAAVGMPAPAVRARAYAHQLSVGMAQRAMIAIALAGNPGLLIADEPTAALDAIVQLQILHLLARTRTSRRLATLLITHDLGVAAAIADRVVVMEQGRAVEQGPAAGILRRPRHPCTQALVRAALPAPGTGSLPAEDAPSIVSLRGVGRHYDIGRGRTVRALDGVDLDIRQGEALGLVGESGCGKSTLARLLLRMEAPSAGRVEVAGHDLASLDAAGRRRLHREAQLVFQDPAGSLDPRLRLGDSLLAPLVHNRIGPAAGRAAAVVQAMAQVGLPEGFVHRLPRECSGGQLQRAVLARALLMRPRLLVCDEPTSALDACTRAEILDLLCRLRVERPELTVLLISHDLRAVRRTCGRVAVMYLGEIVELAGTAALFERPAHPYTQALLASSMLTERGLGPAAIPGEPPNPLDAPAGCRFHARCRLADAQCGTERPPMVDMSGSGSASHAVRCWHWRIAFDDRLMPTNAGGTC